MVLGLPGELLRPVWLIVGTVVSTAAGTLAPLLPSVPGVISRKTTRVSWLDSTVDTTTPRQA